MGDVYTYTELLGAIKMPDELGLSARSFKSSF